MDSDSYPDLVFCLPSGDIGDMKEYIGLFSLGTDVEHFGSFQANGGGTTFNIPHGFGVQPEYINVSPGSHDAAANFFTTVDAVHINVIYTSSTNAGSNNISLWWDAIL